MSSPLQIDADQCIYSLNTGLFFLYADDTTPKPVNDSVCIAHVSRRCQWLGFGISSLTVKALISKVGKVDCACNNKVLPSLVDTRSIEGRWRDISLPRQLWRTITFLPPSPVASRSSRYLCH